MTPDHNTQLRHLQFDFSGAIHSHGTLGGDSEFALFSGRICVHILDFILRIRSLTK